MEEHDADEEREKDEDEEDEKTKEEQKDKRRRRKRKPNQIKTGNPITPREQTKNEKHRTNTANTPSFYPSLGILTS